MKIPRHLRKCKVCFGEVEDVQWQPGFARKLAPADVIVEMKRGQRERSGSAENCVGEDDDRNLTFPLYAHNFGSVAVISTLLKPNLILN